MDVHRGNRHGRSEAARAAVLHAADDLLAERGFAGVTIEGIAERAGVSKQTIYRWWPSKVDVLFEALGDDLAEDLTPPDTGVFADDLRDYLRTLALFLTHSDPGAVLRALTGQAQHDPALAERLRAEHLRPQRERERALLARAGLPPGPGTDAALDRLTGPIYYRVLVTGDPVPPSFTDALADAFLSPGRDHSSASSSA
ncbi:TetR/AcrR family transcriptional regulator [Cryptosporangium phraense]|uniref:TetR/AcrR family transcriptional regulator n=1 Tax=Cryptosporangium phraense TaxID=2593070 RepID=UPI00197A8F5D|nr:TetR/AcrR family transcriptional regulator [Cryptosporangium phraense]